MTSLAASSEVLDEAALRLRTLQLRKSRRLPGASVLWCCAVGQAAVADRGVLHISWQPMQQLYHI